MRTTAEPELDHRVRLLVFEHTVTSGAVPRIAEISSAVGKPPEEVDASLRRLAAERMIVLAPGTSNIWMANPFSAVPTDFRIEARGKTYYGNCIWDGLGVLAILHANGALHTHCPDCGEPMVLTVREQRVEGPGVAHFVVPAARWWDNIGFT